MVDQRDKGSESEDMYSETPDRVSSEGSKLKTCADCGTSKTPLWRGGPAGPKSLCNACGIKSRKKRRAILGVSKGSTEDKKSKKISISSSKQSSSSCSSISSTSRNSGSNSSSKLGKSLKKKLVPLGREVVLQRSVADNKFRSKLGEEEQAAMLLMALSCGSVYA